MTKLYVKKSKDGSLIPEFRSDKEALARYSPGERLRVDVVKPRSLRHNNYLHAVIEVATAFWPASHTFQPENKEHLRAWLECMVGHRDILGETLHHAEGDTLRMLSFMERAMLRIKRSGGYGFFEQIGNSIVLSTPRSTKFEELGEDEFQKVSAPIFEIIRKETGLTEEELFEKAKYVEEAA